MIAKKFSLVFLAVRSLLGPDPKPRGEAVHAAYMQACADVVSFHLERYAIARAQEWTERGRMISTPLPPLVKRG